MSFNQLLINYSFFFKDPLNVETGGAANENNSEVMSPTSPSVDLQIVPEPQGIGKFNRFLKTFWI